MARRVAQRVADDQHEVFVAEYRRRLTVPAEDPPHRRYQPVAIGPTWQRDGRHWLLPELSLGWDVLGWCGTWLQYAPGRPWWFTDEQARFLLWWYAVDQTGRWLYRDAVLQRLKGWGKDPVGACWCGVEMLGPCRFGGWDGDQPRAVDSPQAWVQTAAVALEQTKNTMRLFPQLLSREAIRAYRLQVGKEMIHGLGDTRLIQAVTSAPATLEGARATAVLKNETQHWTVSNAGHEMAAVIERNATKSPDGAARTMAITNAFEPGEDSVGERDRDAYEAVEAGRAEDVGLLYDSLEAPPDAPLTIEEAPHVIEAIRGDSVWLDIPRIVQSIADVRNPPSRSRRFWFNQITATEDAWLAPWEWDMLADATVVVADGDQVTLGFDGSKADDACALMGCRVSDGYLFTVDVWQARIDDEDWEADRVAIDGAVAQTVSRLDVVGFFSDVYPWESYVDAWAEEFGDQLCVNAAAKHPIGWDMRSRTAEFTRACERFHDAVVEKEFLHDGDPRTRQHIVNARRYPNRWGVSIRKEHRESRKKIDAAPAAILAKLARQEYLALPERRRRKKKTGRASFL